MKILTNQTLYQCEYCGKRLLSKNGAKLHEKEYCHVILEKKKEEKQANCNHYHIETSYGYITGEAVMEPKYDYCVDCGKVMNPWGS